MKLCPSRNSNRPSKKDVLLSLLRQYSPPVVFSSSLTLPLALFGSITPCIMSFLKKKSKNKNVQDEVVNALYLLYFQETGLQALDENGEETVLYQAWEILYFAREIAEEVATS